MNIEQRGFEITDISERVAGIDGEHGAARVAFIANVAGDRSFAPWLRPEDVKALIEALTAAYGLMTGETATPAPAPSVGDSLPDSVTDGGGDVWYRIGGTDRYGLGDHGRTLESIKQSYGLGQD